MDISSIDAITRGGALAGSEAARGAGRAGANGFAEALGKALSSVDQAQQQAQSTARRFQLNDSQVTLEETMIALQTANVSFQSLVQVRNRLLSAYHDIMNMQL